MIGVTLSESIPGYAPTRQIRFEDGVRLREPGTLSPSKADVGVDMFSTYGAEILAGRTFNASDVAAADAVVVNRTFVDTYLQDTNALGLRFHYIRGGTEAAATEQWFQIVGVVRDFQVFPSTSPGKASRPFIIPPRRATSIPLRSRFDSPARFLPGLSIAFGDIGAEIDPALQLHGVGSLADEYTDVRSAWRTLAWAIGLVTVSVLLLSAAGMYALMSFTVAQRTREIGIRTALGAQPRRVLLNVFARAIRQLTSGVLIGAVLSAAAFVAIGLGLSSATSLSLAVAALMSIVGLLAALGPARRALRIPASEALRADA